MLIPFGLVLATGILFAFSALQWSREKKVRLRNGEHVPLFLQRPGSREILPDGPARWLAIKGHNVENVQAALGLQHAIPCTWEDGLIEARDHKLFVSPPISGWILVFGSDLPEPSDDVDACFHFLSRLSRQLGHVQYFSSNRVVGNHSWALVDQGRVFRAYAWAGDTLWNEGVQTAAEKDLVMRCFDYCSDQPIFGQKEAVFANAEKIHRLAQRWSIDPASVSEDYWTARLGLLGEPSHLRSI